MKANGLADNLRKNQNLDFFQGRKFAASASSAARDGTQGGAVQTPIGIRIKVILPGTKVMIFFGQKLTFGLKN
jgi:hypothetical protein